MTDNGTHNVPLIPLEKLIGNPAITSIRISPDGRHTSWIAPVNGVLNIWLSIDGAEAKPVTDDRLRGIQHHGWARNSRQLLYIKDQDGDENWNIFAIIIDNGETRQLTDQSGAEHAVAANFAGSSRRRPDEVVVGLNIRDESTHDLYLLNTLTGERSLLQESRPQIHSWHLDRDLTVRGYTIDEIKEATRGFFGTISTNLASVIEYAFSHYGRPSGYVLGSEGGGAFLAGARYGKGNLFMRTGGQEKVYWHGPSLGYDFGAEGSRTLFLIYKLDEPENLFRRFVGVDGSAYVLGGVGLTVLKGGPVLMAPIRTGVGLRLGANIGYVRFTRHATWNPF